MDRRRFLQSAGCVSMAIMVGVVPETPIGWVIDERQRAHAVACLRAPVWPVRRIVLDGVVIMDTPGSGWWNKRYE